MFLTFNIIFPDKHIKNCLFFLCLCLPLLFLLNLYKKYKRFILKGKNLKQYFAARSALQLGLIYEERKDFVAAIEYFKNCMEMKNTAFKNSLDQKAKSGILRCQK